MAKEKKGFECKENEDGSVTCSSYRKLPNGQEVFDGQETTVSASGPNCDLSYTGGYKVLDEDQERFAKIGKKVVAGCKKRQIKKGYS